MISFLKNRFKSFMITVFIINICLIFTPLSAQEENFSIPDSLKTYSFYKLRNKVNNWYFKRKSIELKTYAYTYFKKALKTNDSLLIAEGYEFLSYTVFQEPKEEYYIDKAIDYSKNLKGYYMPAMAYYIKSGIKSDKNNFKEQLDYLLLAHEAAVNGQNLGLVSRVKHDLGALKNRIGEYKEALEYAKDRWDYIKKRPLNTTYLSSLYLLSVTHSYANYLEDATIHNQQGVLLSKKIENESYYAKFVLLEGVNQYFKKNDVVAIDSLKKAISQLKKDELTKNVAASYMYIGKSYIALNKEKEGIRYLKKMDSIFNKVGHLLPYTRDGFKDLIKYAKKEKKIESQLYYTNQLLKLDSVLDINYKSLNSAIYKEFESVELVKNKVELIKKLDEKNKTTMNYVILSIIVAIIIFIGLLYNYIKRKKDYKKFIKIIKKEEGLKIEKTSKNLKKESSSLNDINQDIIDKVLSKLKQFEDNEEFLKPNITLKVLSKKTQTNSKYVSKIINHYKEKSAINYVNDLRINYAINRIRDNRTFRKYTIKSIASDIGYANSQAFSTAFYKKTGLKPSYFIKEIEKGNFVD